MQVNSPSQPAAVREPAPTGTGGSTSGPPPELPVKQSNAQTFSGNEIKGTPGNVGGKHSALRKDGVYSAEFGKAFGLANIALDSLESRAYAQHCDWVSPEAEEAIHHLKDLVQQKIAASRTGGFAKDGSSVSPLTPHEHQAWLALLNSLPSAYKNYVQASLNTADESSASRSQGAYSPEFTKAYKAARLALESEECKFYQDQLGWLSPRAEEAVEKLRGVVSNKAGGSRSAKLAQHSFPMKPLTPDENQAYAALVHSLPPVYKTALPKTSNWKAAKPDEVFQALNRDSAMHKLMSEQPEEFLRFSHELTEAINSKSSEMSEGDKGMAITFRFPECYQKTAHIALAGVWRDEDGKLKMSFCHQESFPPKAKGQPYAGVVCDGFDTSASYPGGRAPVIESMRMAGPPAASVFPCPHPEAIVKATQDIAGPQHVRQYAPTYTWIKKMGVEPAPLAPETCFNVTHKVIAAMYYAKAEEQALMPSLLTKMEIFANNLPNQFRTIVGDKPGQLFDLDTIPSLPLSDQIQAFLKFGAQWGTSLPWDVQLQTVTRTQEMHMRPGQKGIDLPPQVRAIKFLSVSEHLTLNGEAIRLGRTYTASEASAMVFNGNKPVVVNALVAMPKAADSNLHAKL